MESLMCRLCLKNFENIVKTPIVSKKRQPKKIKSNRPENTCGPDQSESDVAIEGSEDEWLMISTEMIVTTTKNMNQKLCFVPIRFFPKRLTLRQFSDLESLSINKCQILLGHASDYIYWVSAAKSDLF